MAMRLEEIWFADDAASDDPTGLPELKRFVQPARGKEEAGFRALLDDPDALSNLGWCGETERRHEGRREARPRQQMSRKD
jgi:hypothetical protein